MSKKTRLWCDEDFKRFLKSRADLQGKTLIEFTSELAENFRKDFDSGKSNGKKKRRGKYDFKV